MSPKILCSRHSQWHCSCFYTQLRISPCSLEMHICAGRCQASIRQVSHWWSYLSQLKEHRLGTWSSTSRRREREEWRRKMEAGRGGEWVAGNMWCTAPRQPASQPASGTLMTIMSCHTSCQPVSRSCPCPCPSPINCIDLSQGSRGKSVSIGGEWLMQQAERGALQTDRWHPTPMCLCVCLCVFGGRVKVVMIIHLPLTRMH